jgi:hypothetical protein
LINQSHADAGHERDENQRQHVRIGPGHGRKRIARHDADECLNAKLGLLGSSLELRRLLAVSCEQLLFGFLRQLVAGADGIYQNQTEGDSDSRDDEK